MGLHPRLAQCPHCSSTHSADTQSSWDPVDCAPTHPQHPLPRIPPRDHLNVPTPVLTDAPRRVVLRPTGYQPRLQPTSPQVPTGGESIRLSTSRRLPATNQPSTVSANRPAGRNHNNNNRHNNYNNNNTTNTFPILVRFN